MNETFRRICQKTQITFAKVIELDSQNIMHCQEQLKNDDWDQNVLILYVKNSPGTDKFRAIYEQVSIEYPERHLFVLKVFDPKTNAEENQLIWKNVKGCLTNMWSGAEELLGNINAKTPAILLDDYARATVRLDTQAHRKLSTKEDIVEFIGEKKQPK